jgi:NAD-dependent SIR2 family protein deacetylase
MIIIARQIITFRVFESMQIDFPNEVDLIFVSGTSLTVSPANGIVTQVSGTCPRVIINNEKVGKFLGIRISHLYY